jgi:hypothetical protein
VELTDRELYFLTAARLQENRCENYSALPGAWTEPAKLAAGQRCAEPAWSIFACTCACGAHDGWMLLCREHAGAARTTGIRCIHCAEDGLYCPVAITAARPL